MHSHSKHVSNVKRHTSRYSDLKKVVSAIFRDFKAVTVLVQVSLSVMSQP